MGMRKRKLFMTGSWQERESMSSLKIERKMQNSKRKIITEIWRLFLAESIRTALNSSSAFGRRADKKSKAVQPVL